MCLDTVKRTFKGGGKTVKIGYKWMMPLPKGEGYESPCMGRIHKLNVWDTAHGEEINDGWVAYPAGFHIFTNKREAKQHWLKDEENCVLVQVHYKGVVAIGTELDDPCGHTPVSLDIVVAKHVKFKRKVR